MELEAKHNLTGRVFGKWTVSDKHTTDGRNRLWWCTCSCGHSKWVKAQYLKGGTSRQCVSCGHAPRGYKDVIPHPVWARIQTNANKRGIVVEATRDEASGLLIKQKYRCALSGLSISVPSNSSEITTATASLDRIDSSRGYTADNIQWVHKSVNMMKHTLTNDQFIAVCHLVAAHVPLQNKAPVNTRILGRQPRFLDDALVT